MVVLPITAVIGIVNTRLIVQNFGAEAYAQFGLLVTIAALIPFSNLGMYMVVINAVSESENPSEDPHVRRVLITSIRILSASAAGILLVVAVISLLDGWPALLGDGLVEGTGPAAVAGCVVLIALTLPVSVGQPVLTALRRNHVQVLVMGLQRPLVLAGLLTLVALGVGGSFIAWLPYVAVFGLSAVLVLLASRALGPTVAEAIRAVPRLRTEPGTKVFSTAAPALVVMVSMPLAMQSDRLVLSHVADAASLTSYNLAAQIYLPISSVVAAAGASLWPIFARSRRRGDGRSPYPVVVGFGVGALAACTVLTLAAPWLAGVAADGQIELSLGIRLSFTALIVIQAARYPLGTYLSDTRGLRFQAITATVALPVNVVVSVYLGQRHGVIGPVIGSAASMLVFEFLTNIVYISRVRPPAPAVDRELPQ